jgi:RNA-binding protein YhbY
MVPMPQGLAHMRRNSSRVISGRLLTVFFSQSKSCSSSLGLRPHRWCRGSMLPSLLRWASSFFTMCTETLKRSAISWRVPSAASYASTIRCRKSSEIVFISHLSVFGGYTKMENALKDAERALGDHELIKVRFIDHKDEKKTLSEKIAAQTGAALLGIRGHLACFFRPSPVAHKKKIALPE